MHKNQNQLPEDDQYLWNALKHSDPIALNRLFTKHYTDLYFYGLKLSNNQDYVTDTIQDIFANIWETRKRISKVKHVKAYLFTALRNNLLKSKPKAFFIRLDTVINPIQEFGFDISPEDIYLGNESKRENIKIIKDLLADLSPKQKEIIYLKFYGNYSNTEISKILSIKPQSVANLLMRTINLLRKKKKENNLPIFNMLIFYLL